jgi:two-component system response regulator
LPDMAEPVEILLVEDNPHDVELTLLAFRRHNFSNAIHVARDGEEALDFMFGTGPFANRASIETPRVILLDLKLPKIDGLDVLRALKSDPRTKRTPVVVLTSSREGRDVQEAYDIGASSYIVKPVEFDKFLEAAKQLGLYWLLLNEASPLPL